MLIEDKASMLQGVHLMIGHRPYSAGVTPNASMPTARPRGCLILKVGTFADALYDEAKKLGWVVIRMKNDWMRVFAFYK